MAVRVTTDSYIALNGCQTGQVPHLYGILPRGARSKVFGSSHLPKCSRLTLSLLKRFIFGSPRLCCSEMHLVQLQGCTWPASVLMPLLLALVLLLHLPLLPLLLPVNSSIFPRELEPEHTDNKRTGRLLTSNNSRHCARCCA